MSVTDGCRIDFVYAMHTDEYAEEIGHALLDDFQPPEIVALEWAHLGRTPKELAEALPLVIERLSLVTDPRTPTAAIPPALERFGSFYGNVLHPLVGSGVEIVLIDVYEDIELGERSNFFNSYEQNARLSAIVSDPSMSLEGRQNEMLAIATKSAGLVALRELVVSEQIADLKYRTSHLAVFQGLAHYNGLMETHPEVATARHLFVPELIAWPGQDEVSEVDHLPVYSKLMRTIVDQPTAVSEQLINKTVLAEYIIALISNSPNLQAEIGDVYGASIVASRIAEGIPEDRLQAKLRALNKASRNGTSTNKILLPLFPKHPLNVFA
jgi:hypothetical protein